MRVERIGDATLYLGDCIEILPTLPKVDAVITDPPYGIGFAARPTNSQRAHGHKAAAWDDCAPAAEVFSLLLDMAPKVAIWGGNYFGLPPSRGWLAWTKSGSAPSMADLELCWTNIDQNARAFNKSVKSSALEKDMTRGFHPTQKSVPLMAWTLEQLGAADRVLDPFMGSGTTGVACAQLGRKFVGIEIDPKYFDIACRRIDQAYAQGKLFEPDGNGSAYRTQGPLFEKAAP